MSVIEALRQFCSAVGMPAPPEGLHGVTLSVIDLQTAEPHVVIDFNCEMPRRESFNEKISSLQARKAQASA